MTLKTLGASGLSLMLLSTGAALAQAPPIPPEELPAGSEVLARGPVHEAFAEPVPLRAESPIVAPHEPPPAIVEYPPDARPEGAGYVWVPGYWSWDADRSGFIWVSACWRIAPPSMRWVPGYWFRVSTGWEWVAGFWEPSGSRAIDYLPAPPDPIDLIAPGPPPGPTSVWVPGCWYWESGRYVARHGYWLAERTGWVWVPSHYLWTPRGYVFVAGHWDYTLRRRGVLFAPVYFPRSVHLRAGFSFSPGIAVDISLLIGNLFAYPRYAHYYFGDYYDGAYARIGIHPQFDGERVHTWYDPIYQYERMRHRKDDPKWEDHQRETYDRRRADKNLRPPHTYRDVQARTARLPQSERHAVQIVAPLRTIVTRQAPSPTLEPITDRTRRKVSKKGVAVNTYRDKRERWETPPPPPAAPSAPRERTTSPRERTTPPTERATPQAPRGRATPAAPKATPAPAPTAPKVPPNRPERVRIPASPVAGKRASSASTAPPPTPPKERAAQRGEKGKAKPKAKPKEKTKPKDK